MQIVKNSYRMDRKENQDIIIEDPANQIYIIADGMGGKGHKGGKIAAENTADMVYRGLVALRNDLDSGEIEEGDVKYGLVEIIERTNTVVTLMGSGTDRIKQVRKEFDDKTLYALSKLPLISETYGCGSTLDACFIYSEKLYLIHVGDSSIMQANPNVDSIDLLTTPQVMYRGDTSELTDIEKQVLLSHQKLTSYVGQGEAMSPQISIRKMLPDDVLVLTTDGITSTISMQELLAIIKSKNFEKIPDLIKEPEEIMEAYNSLKEKMPDFDKELEEKDNASFLVRLP